MAVRTYVFLKDPAVISLALAMGYPLKFSSASPHPYLACWEIGYDLGGKMVKLHALDMPGLPEGYRTYSAGLTVQASAIATIFEADEEKLAALPPVAPVAPKLRKVKRRI